MKRRLLHAFVLNGGDLVSAFYAIRVNGKKFSDSRRVTLAPLGGRRFLWAWGYSTFNGWNYSV